MELPATEVPASAFRDVMSRVCTPVSVVTAMDHDRPHGTTVSAFASLSMAPPMVLVALDRDSELLGLLRGTGTFGVNVLASDQSGIAKRFARKGSAKFDGVSWRSCGGLPRLHGGVGWLACEVAELIDGGDHILALGDVRVADSAPGAPLTYHARRFGTHAALEVRP